MNEQIIINPISDLVRNSITETTDKLKIAVPFISSFAKKIIDKKNVQNIQDKRIVTKFDETNINTFDLPTLEHLLNCGFDICFNNKIHLKLYITDNNTFITSSNLTNGGFENNIELTVKIDSGNYKKSEQIFENLWLESKANKVTKDLINQNRDKYDVLKKRQKFEKRKITSVKENFNVGKLNIQLLIDKIFNSKEDQSWVLEKSYEANKLRNKILRDIKTKAFDKSLYYSPKGHPKRYNNLYYYFAIVDSKIEFLKKQDFPLTIEFIFAIKQRI